MKNVPESFGLYRARLHPTDTLPGTDGWWEVADEESARATVHDMVSRLEAVGWSRLDALLDPATMLEQVSIVGDLGEMKREYQKVYFLHAEAILLMDQGRSPRLEKVLAEHEVLCADLPPDARTYSDRLICWIREQASAAS